MSRRVKPTNAPLPGDAANDYGEPELEPAAEREPLPAGHPLRLGRARCGNIARRDEIPPAGVRPLIEREDLAASAIDAPYVTIRLEEAGAALLALPESGWSTKLRTSAIDVVRAAAESYGWQGRVRPARPSAATISRMDEAMGWLQLIPVERYVLRRIVGARSLVSPLTEKHLFPWRRLAAALGADHKAVQRWHAEGIGIIVAALNCPPTDPQDERPAATPASARARIAPRIATEAARGRVRAGG